MNDIQIRTSFHRSELNPFHNDSQALVIDELGLLHGKSRADIAIINEKLIGFEIKSDVDSLSRLDKQVPIYDKVFDLSSLILTSQHIKEGKNKIPKHWGIILAKKNDLNLICFETIREKNQNPNVDSYSVAQLLWKNEVICFLQENGYTTKSLRQKRSYLYQCLIQDMDPTYLREFIKKSLKARKTWRSDQLLIQYGG